MSIARLAVACVLCLFAALVHADSARVALFSPQGTAKGVRQATARFSAPMVPFGEPRLPDPFDVELRREPARGRWIDDRNWAYDFAGASCRPECAAPSRLKSGLVDVAGQPVDAASFDSPPVDPRSSGRCPSEGARGDRRGAGLRACARCACHGTERARSRVVRCRRCGRAHRRQAPARERSAATVLEANRAFIEEQLRRHYRPGGRAYRKSDWTAALALGDAADRRRPMPAAFAERRAGPARVGKGHRRGERDRDRRRSDARVSHPSRLSRAAHLHPREQAGAVHPRAADRAHLQRADRRGRKRSK